MAINFPLFASLPKEAQMAMRIAERMRDFNETIGQASKYLYEYSWNATRLADGLTKATTSMSELGVTSAEASELVTFGSEAAAEAAAAAEAGAGGGGLMALLSTIGEYFGFEAGVAATAAGTVVVAGGVIIAGGIVYGASNYLGSRAGDASIKADPMGDPTKRALGGNTTLSWNWSVTTVDFAGNLSGGPKQWSFHGILAGGGNAIWHPEKGSGTADCTLTTSSNDNAQLKCSANLTQGEFVDGQWKPRQWVGEADGTIETQLSDGKQRIGFRGKGSGDGGGGKAGIDHLDLTARK